MLSPRTTGFSERGIDPASRIIFDLARRDIVSADGVFITYLNNYISNPELPLNQLLWLGGYPFGYGESVGFMAIDLSGILATPHRLTPPIEPNPFLAQVYLDIAYKKIVATLNQPSSLSQTNTDAVNGLALFSICYLIPEVLRYTPNMFPAWQQLYWAALANTSSERQEIIRGQLRFVNQLRKRSGAKPISDDPHHYTKKFNDTPRSIDEMPEGCEKEISYIKYVLSADLKQDYSTVLGMTKKIRDTKARASVQELVHFRKAMMLDGSSTLDEVKNISSQVTAPELNALLYARIAARTTGKNNQQTATDALRLACDSVSSIENKSTKAAALLAVIRAIKEVDQDKVKELVGELITQVNDMDDGNIDTLSISYGVKTNCNSAASGLSGSRLGYNEKASFLDTISSLKFTDADEVVIMCAKIKDETTRIRLTARIASNMLGKLRTRTSTNTSQMNGD